MTSKDIYSELKETLMDRYGPVISGNDLISCLGYPSPSAFRKAVSRKTAPDFIFTLKNRKGKFALTTDVAAWLTKSKYKKDLDKM